AADGTKVIYADGLTIANAVAVTGTVSFDQTAGSATQSGVISGSGGLTKTGSGTLTLTGANAYAGGTTLNSGGLSLTSDTALGTGGVSAADGTKITYADTLTIANAMAVTGTVSFDQTGGGATLGGVISGSGEITKMGSGTLTLTGVNTYAGGTMLSSGGLSLTSDTALGTGAVSAADGTKVIYADGLTIANAVAVTGTVDFDQTGGSAMLGGVISGAGGITKTGSGTLTLTGANTYAGGTTLSSGGLSLTTDSALGTGAVSAADGTKVIYADGLTVANAMAVTGTVSFDQTGGSATLGGVISGVGGITKAGSGTLTLTGANTYAGGTTLSSGGLSLTTDTALGTGDVSAADGTKITYADTLTIANAVAVTGTVSFDQAGGSATQGGVISGSGGLTKTGSASLTLSGANSYQGTTTVSAGTLIVASDGALGTTDGATTVQSGATLALSGASSGDSITISGSGNGGVGALHNSSGSSTLSGAVTLGDASTIAADGTLLTLSGGISGDHDLTFTGAGAASVTSAIATGSGSLTKSGAGSLTLTGANTYTGGTSLDAGSLSLGNADALGTGALAAADGTSLTYQNVTVANAMSLTGTVTFKMDSGDGEQSGVISGTGSLIKADAGMLTLSGANTYSGGTTINGGTVTVMDASAFGSGGVTLNDNAAIVLGDGIAISNALTLAGTISLGADDADVTTYSATISGTGTLTKTGSGTLILTGANSFTGNTTLSGGTLALANNAALGTGSLTADDGTSVTYADDLTIANTITLNGAVDFTQGNGTATQSGVISGAGTLTKAGSGELILTAANSFTGDTALSGGTLQLANNDALGTSSLMAADGTTVVYAEGVAVANAVGLDGTVEVVRASGTATQSGAISGTGSLSKTGAGTLVLTGANTFTGGVTLSEGAVILGDDSALGTGKLAAADGTTVSVAGDRTFANEMNLAGAVTFALGSDSVALDGEVSGSGTLAKLGTGTLTLSADNSFDGTIAVAAGTVQLGASERLADTSAIVLAEGATFDLDGYNESIATLTGTGSVVLGDASATAGLSAAASSSRYLLSDGARASGTFAEADVIAAAGGSGNVLTLGGTNADFAFGGTFSGSGSVRKIGSGIFTVVGDQALIGDFEVLEGTLEFLGVSDGGLLVNGGTFSGTSGFNSALTMTSGVISPGTADDPFGTITASSINLTGGLVQFDFAARDSGYLSDMLRSSGSITVNGTTVEVRMVNPSLSSPPIQRYLIVRGGSFSGSFANGQDFTDLGQNTGIAWRLRYDLEPNGVVLEVRRMLDLAAQIGNAGTRNEQSVAAALSVGQGEMDDAFLQAILPIGMLPLEEQLALLDTLSGEGIASITTGGFLETQRFSGLLLQRLSNGEMGELTGAAPEQARALVPGAPPSAQAGQSQPVTVGMWMQSFGGETRLEGTSGTRNLREDAKGLVGGVEAQMGHFRAGLALGYSDSDSSVSSLQTRLDGDFVHFGGYLGYDDGERFGGVYGSHQTSHVESSRAVRSVSNSYTASAKIAMEGQSLGGYAGFRTPISKNMTLTPLIAITNIHIDRDAFTESGADPLNLGVATEVRDITTARAQMRLEMKTQMAGGSIAPFFVGGLERSWGDLKARTNMRFSGTPFGLGSFSVDGTPLKEMVGVLGGGVTYTSTGGLEIGASFDTRLSDRLRQGTVEAHVRIPF
ncbi:hypothetical protein D2V17_19090, partial [Aurantiacibacter xanthus]